MFYIVLLQSINFYILDESHNYTDNHHNVLFFCARSQRFKSTPRYALGLGSDQKRLCKFCVNIQLDVRYNDGTSMFSACHKMKHINITTKHYSSSFTSVPGTSADVIS